MTQAPFECALAQERSRVVPERLRKGIAYIGAGDADIGEHAAVQPGQNIGLTAMTPRPRYFFEPMGDQGHQEGKRPQERAAGDW